MPSSRKAAKGLLLRPTKISPPALPKILPRPRLQELFEKNEDKNLVLIIGQAAQGKSTVAACHFQNFRRPSAWVNLGREDSDPLNFFYLLVQATRSPLSLLSLTLSPKDNTSRYRKWASALFKTLDNPFQICLDGLDRLAPQTETCRFLQILIEEMPPFIRLFLLSREYPPLSIEFQQRKMSRQALLLKNEDLAFTPLEINQYFRKLHGLSLNAEQVEQIFKTTEGWIGGITFLSETLNQLPQSAIDEVLGDKLPDRFYRDTFQYFGQEAFSALTSPQQNFLLRTSILDRLEPGMIRDFFPEEKGQDFLKELTRKNCFVQAFPDPEKGVTFRYHPLFKNFLRTLLRSKLSVKEIQELQAHAGAYYEKKGELEEAITHYLEARSYLEAAALIKLIGLALVKKACLPELMRWLQVLPQPLIQADPWLLLFKALANRFVTLEENMHTLKEAVILFKNQGDRSGLLLGMAFLIEAEFTWGKHRPGLIGEAEELLSFPDEDSYLYERAILWRQIGLVQAIRGNPRRGYWACQNAYLLANQIGDPHLQASALANAITCLSVLGEFRQAERLLQELNSFSWRFPNAEILFIHSISKVIYLLSHGDLQTALELCNTILEETEKQGLAYLYPFVLFHKQIIQIYIQEYQQAVEINNQLLNLATAVNNGFLKGVTTFFSGIAAYWSDRRTEAQNLIDQSIALFAGGDSFSEVYLYGARLARGLLNDYPENRLAVITDLREVLDYWEAFESHLFLTEGHLALGLLCHAQGLGEQAREHLQKGFKIAQQRDYCHFRIISPRDTVRACLLVQETLEEGNSVSAYASELLIKKYARLADGELEEWSHHPNPQVSQKALEVQRSIRRADTPVLRIETFGGLRLYFDNREMDDKAWDRHQPRQLLVAILSQKKEKIHKEALIEALWPEEEPGIGEKNFKTTLQRLRKSLEPNISQTFGSSYIHLHHNQLFLDEELCRVDSRKFGALYKEGEDKEKSGNGKGALDCFSRALDLYHGDFIPEEDYPPWAENRREDLKNIYTDLLTRTARYHEQAGSFKKAVACLKQAVEADPLLEEAYRGLMSLYAGKNMVNEALRTYEACRKALKTGMDTLPDPVTTALYQGIKERMKK